MHSGPSYEERQRLEANRAKIKKVFRGLRALGYLARQSFSCCGGCAGNELTGIAVQRVAAGKTVRGSIYYHRQDTDTMMESGALYLRYGPLHEYRNGGYCPKTLLVVQGRKVRRGSAGCGAAGRPLLALPFYHPGRDGSCPCAYIDRLDARRPAGTAFGKWLKKSEGRSVGRWRCCGAMSRRSGKRSKRSAGRWLC